MEGAGDRGQAEVEATRGGDGTAGTHRWRGREALEAIIAAAFAAAALVTTLARALASGAAGGRGQGAGSSVLATRTDAASNVATTGRRFRRQAGWLAKLA